MCNCLRFLGEAHAGKPMRADLCGADLGASATLQPSPDSVSDGLAGPRPRLVPNRRHSGYDTSGTSVREAEKHMKENEMGPARGVMTNSTQKVHGSTSDRWSGPARIGFALAALALYSAGLLVAA